MRIRVLGRQIAVRFRDGYFVRERRGDCTGRAHESYNLDTVGASSPLSDVQPEDAQRAALV